MIWVHTYKIGKKVITVVHHSEESAIASQEVLKGKITPYVVAEEKKSPPVLEYLGTGKAYTALDVINNKQGDVE